MELREHVRDEGDETSLVILQSLICLLREKNLLSRADIEELHDNVRERAAGASDPFACCAERRAAAAREMAGIDQYLGARYGGKHRRMS
ncbi:hypothetical protein GGQ80_002238 [Sphingomonas jinjuensis]|uniref:Uncharacterized protein n=1 Tax=Sphingomonas jinjuensis TaxID=535907 RepID=A0A840FLZ6_9SPHN|nr:hypothetical protein [Sphingomonas jinjuensis]MBB4154325.1 hypothetical protein [Sphingomonas jinjuensis]